ncbi:nucleotidyl transferase AbiEii/AbiGii toxin family protein [Qingrenia yutianensis]|uniref:Nucleotidyl transferase AbiEii/AbiGii toxin family protein n=1 Tax=Qingrenia yutianensis TaxID=2763676 RepID=A0A926FCR1_9FIRM|nr:nucleotidyl transferase AbiEii/AbiGii toxin family protein [Qingrenia yutianensis]MBC8596317.1 nucleotidyl transferase AbiEii/AbiGii toxin family protein [Qingrenia yutianensis]
MKNAMQLKAYVKNLAKEKKISAQIVLQNYMLERLLERISVSKYHDNFILKGGFLLAAMVGLDTRATMDMDATIKGLPVTKETISGMFVDICKIHIDDDINFEFSGIDDIREDDEYGGYRVSLTGNYPPMAVPLKIDITTGDKITPREMVYSFNLMFEERSINVLAYTVETILAEKLETIISRGNQNTRQRDYYDVYILNTLQKQNIDNQILKEAFAATVKKRGTGHIVANYKEIIETVANSTVMNNQWTRYQKEFEYAKEISFENTCKAVNELMEEI